MDDKTMCVDALTVIRFEIRKYQGIILDTENSELRQIFQQIRNNNESLQYELFKVAKCNKYYIYSEKSTPNQIKNVVNEIQ